MTALRPIDLIITCAQRALMDAHDHMALADAITRVKQSLIELAAEADKVEALATENAQLMELLESNDLDPTPKLKAVQTSHSPEGAEDGGQT